MQEARHPLKARAGAALASGPGRLRGLDPRSFDLGAGAPFADRFRLEREAGVGALSTVYRALDQASGEPVALKVLRRSDGASLQRFATQARALERLRHPAVVRYVAHGLGGEGEPYLATEWLEGEILRARLERGPLGAGEAAAIGRRLFGALLEARTLGLGPSDVGASRVMLVGGLVEGATIIAFGPPGAQPTGA